ncbi:Nif3-like dinuclear metal center hexameric protein [Pollutimonas harenae]|uniref:Nif3-like dinuclear metal center hexameric protein n=1 Tax=Pollutimonas harenae TaxID=657015 RepID=A0A853GYE1_9BURK|nr:Nif3-like dinuclear metal center hexameric protein [Pollutimonas harenae]NYT84399.1 Nif3-like dinuclear metal center hexameric protein [Pollutimonas harenae]TEA73200.1 Nif3-like dinuclear metal center hexameric protein [Pollutimonas harenae]
MNQVSTQQLADWLETTLQAQRFKDYCPNGLQVEGKSSISHIITGVTATQALLETAVQKNADAILVHHGWFWKNENPVVRGTKRARLALALGHQLNVFAYHLPLDAHPTLGNNAQLGRVLGFEPELDADGKPVCCGPDNLIWLGRCRDGQTLETLGDHICNHLQRTPLLVGNLQQKIRRIAWCTGGAQGMMQAAVDAGVDAYLTGEASEPTYHLAQETGTAFIGAGHHATERYGVQALGQAIATEFGIKVEFVDIDNPI